MKAKDALAICRNINSDKYTDAEKLEAVRELWTYTTKDLTKPKMVWIISFLLKQLERLGSVRE